MEIRQWFIIIFTMGRTMAWSTETYIDSLRQNYSNVCSRRNDVTVINKARSRSSTLHTAMQQSLDKIRFFYMSPFAVAFASELMDHVKDVVSSAPAVSTLHDYAYYGHSDKCAAGADDALQKTILGYQTYECVADALFLNHQHIMASDSTGDWTSKQLECLSFFLDTDGKEQLKNTYIKVTKPSYSIGNTVKAKSLYGKNTCFDMQRAFDETHKSKTGVFGGAATAQVFDDSFGRMWANERMYFKGYDRIQNDGFFSANYNLRAKLLEQKLEKMWKEEHERILDGVKADMNTLIAKPQFDQTQCNVIMQRLADMHNAVDDMQAKLFIFRQFQTHIAMITETPEIAFDSLQISLFQQSYNPMLIEQFDRALAFFDMKISKRYSAEIASEFPDARRIYQRSMDSVIQDINRLGYRKMERLASSNAIKFNVSEKCIQTKIPERIAFFNQRITDALDTLDRLAATTDKMAELIGPLFASTTLISTYSVNLRQNAAILRDMRTEQHDKLLETRCFSTISAVIHKLEDLRDSIFCNAHRLFIVDAQWKNDEYSFLDKFAYTKLYSDNLLKCVRQSLVTPNKPTFVENEIQLMDSARKLYAANMCEEMRYQRHSGAIEILADVERREIEKLTTIELSKDVELQSYRDRVADLREDAKALIDGMDWNAVRDEILKWKENFQIDDCRKLETKIQNLRSDVIKLRTARSVFRPLSSEVPQFDNLQLARAISKDISNEFWQQLLPLQTGLLRMLEFSAEIWISVKEADEEFDKNVSKGSGVALQSYVNEVNKAGSRLLSSPMLNESMFYPDKRLDDPSKTCNSTKMSIEDTNAMALQYLAVTLRLGSVIFPIFARRSDRLKEYLSGVVGRITASHINQFMADFEGNFEGLGCAKALEMLKQQQIELTLEMASSGLYAPLVPDDRLEGKLDRDTQKNVLKHIGKLEASLSMIVPQNDVELPFKIGNYQRIGDFIQCLRATVLLDKKTISEGEYSGRFINGVLKKSVAAAQLALSVTQWNEKRRPICQESSMNEASVGRALKWILQEWSEFNNEMTVFIHASAHLDDFIKLHLKLELNELQKAFSVAANAAVKKRLKSEQTHQQKCEEILTSLDESLESAKQMLRSASVFVPILANHKLNLVEMIEFMPSSCSASQETLVKDLAEHIKVSTDAVIESLILAPSEVEPVKKAKDKLLNSLSNWIASKGSKDIYPLQVKIFRFYTDFWTLIEPMQSKESFAVRIAFELIHENSNNTSDYKGIFDKRMRSVEKRINSLSEKEPRYKKDLQGAKAHLASCIERQIAEFKKVQHSDVVDPKLLKTINACTKYHFRIIDSATNVKKSLFG